MIVDNDCFSSYAVKSMMKQQSFNCDIAYNGRQAMDFVKKRFEKDKSSYQLIMMEYYLPISKGNETTVMIRSYLSKNAPDL